MSTTVKLSIDEQVEFLMQGTAYGDPQTKINMAAELRQRLIEAEKEGRPLRVYCGYDPRTTDLHLGHTITMRKLRQFQDLGHDVTFLIGTFTSLIGDPSDKDSARDQLTAESVRANAQTYADQAFKILDPDKTRVRHNDEWLAGLNFADIIHLASNFTVQQFLSRENFRVRYDDGTPIYLHEFFYALMQAYDAVAQEADVQVGGQDQLFNIVVAGRKLQQALGQRPQVAIIMGESLPGTDGDIKMSKSLGNHIPIMAAPEDMYGKVMSVPDKALVIFHKLVLEKPIHAMPRCVSLARSRVSSTAQMRPRPLNRTSCGSSRNADCRMICLSKNWLPQSVWSICLTGSGWWDLRVKPNGWSRVAVSRLMVRLFRISTKN